MERERRRGDPSVLSACGARPPFQLRFVRGDQPMPTPVMLGAGCWQREPGCSWCSLHAVTINLFLMGCLPPIGHWSLTDSYPTLYQRFAYIYLRSTHPESFPVPPHRVDHVFPAVSTRCASGLPLAPRDSQFCRHLCFFQAPSAEVVRAPIATRT